MKSLLGRLVGIMALLVVVTLTGCASKTLPPANYDSAEVGKVKKVTAGTIVSMRAVNIRTRDEAANTADAMPVRSHGYEYVIKLNSGAIVSVVQTEEVPLKTKQKVLLIGGDTTRVVPDDGSEDV